MVNVGLRYLGVDRSSKSGKTKLFVVTATD
jgi:hypothetical protein